MPPLLAALLMIELGCTLDIVRAIDLCVEWRRVWNGRPLGYVEYSNYWYAGQLGTHFARTPASIGQSTYLWPSPVHYRPRRYSRPAPQTKGGKPKATTE